MVGIRCKFFYLISTLFIGAYLSLIGSACARPATRTTEEQRIIDVYKQVSKGVVFITTVTLTVDPFDLFATIRPQEGSGSGIIVDAERGIIVTNLHVIQNAHKIEILVADAGAQPARLLGYDQEYDIAVLQLERVPKGLVAIPFGDSSSLEIGQRVLAIGNPFGLNRTLTQGIVSSLERTVRGAGGVLMEGLVQTDAAINPGNSGGPLLDVDGRLVGVNTAILSQSGDSAGIGFAVPVSQIRLILPDLISTGRVRRPKIGWILVDTASGPMVRRVSPGGPADKAGVQPIERPVSNVFLRGYVRDFERADVIVSVNGTRVYSVREIDKIVMKQKTEQPISFVLGKLSQGRSTREVKITPVIQ